MKVRLNRPLLLMSPYLSLILSFDQWAYIDVYVVDPIPSSERGIPSLRLWRFITITAAVNDDRQLWPIWFILCWFLLMSMFHLPFLCMLQSPVHIPPLHTYCWERRQQQRQGFRRRIGGRSIVIQTEAQYRYWLRLRFQFSFSVFLTLFLLLLTFPSLLPTLAVVVINIYNLIPTLANTVASPGYLSPCVVLFSILLESPASLSLFPKF